MKDYDGVLRVYNGSADRDDVITEIGFTVKSKSHPTLGQIFDRILHERRISDIQIDRMAEDIKEKFCESVEPDERHEFEIGVYSYLQEVLDPWRR